MVTTMALIHLQEDNINYILAPSRQIYNIRFLRGDVIYNPLPHESGAYALHHFFPNYSGREEQRQGACEIARIIGIDRVPDTLLADLGVAFWNEGVPGRRNTHIEWFEPDLEDNEPDVLSLTLTRLMTRA